MKNDFLILKSILVLIFIGASSISAAEFKPFQKANEKSEAKQKSGWSLDEWLAQRDKNRMMDLWLAMNTSEPYEFYLNLQQDSYSRKTKTASSSSDKSFTSSKIAYAAYASIVGLAVQYENNLNEDYSDLSGSFRLRLFGNADQSSNLTIGFGQKTVTDATTSHRMLFPEALINLHFIKQFGIQGYLAQYQKTSDSDWGDTSGQKTSYGVFIDFSMLRIFGNYYSDVLITNPAGLETTTTRAGIESGLRFYF